MVEWYRAGEPYEALMVDCELVVTAMARVLRGTTRVHRGGRAIELAGPWPRLSVREALRRFAGVELQGDEPAARMHELARVAGVRTAPSDEWDDVFHRIFLERVEPHLGLDRPTVVTEWPVQLAALARRKADDPTVVERFEVYAGELELANAFGELTDAAEQRSRLEADQRVRARRGKPVYPLDEKFLDALGRGLVEPTSGIALGVDRLLMLLLETPTIAELLAFAAGPDEAMPYETTADRTGPAEQ
jgi:lysyl-tRNA synthetase class 2